jgi:hypothetical protein
MLDGPQNVIKAESDLERTKTVRRLHENDVSGKIIELLAFTCRPFGMGRRFPRKG